MKIKFFFILFPLFLSSLLFSQSASVSSLENHIWRNSIGGGLITGIQIGPEAAFVLGDNKALQVYHRNGNLLWRTYFSGEVEPFLYVSKRFFSFVVVKRAGHYYLNAINRGGKIVWEQEIPGKVQYTLVYEEIPPEPVEAPVENRGCWIRNPEVFLRCPLIS